MTVNLAWSEIWLSLFERMDSPTKTKFLRDCEIIEIVRTSVDAVQIEILENAPTELIEYLKGHLRPKAASKLLPKKYIEPSTQPRRVLPDKVYLDIAKRIRQ